MPRQHYVRQWEVGQYVRVRPILELPADPNSIYRRRAAHTYPATVTETFHLRGRTIIRVELEKHERLVLSDAQRNMTVSPAALHHCRCGCRRCTRRPRTRGLDSARPRLRRWASVLWAKYERLFDY